VKKRFSRAPRHIQRERSSLLGGTTGRCRPAARGSVSYHQIQGYIRRLARHRNRDEASAAAITDAFSFEARHAFGNGPRRGVELTRRCPLSQAAFEYGVDHALSTFGCRRVRFKPTTVALDITLQPPSSIIILSEGACSSARDSHA
jgi:hypothetical protein